MKKKNKRKPKNNGKNRLQDPKTGKFIMGNPGGGRPEGSVSVVEAIKRKLQEVSKEKKKSYLEYLVDQIIKKGIVDGDVSMIKDIIDRVDGKALQSIEFKDKDELNSVKQKVNSFFKNDKKKKKRD